MKNLMEVYKMMTRQSPSTHGERRRIRRRLKEVLGKRSLAFSQGYLISKYFEIRGTDVEERGLCLYPLFPSSYGWGIAVVDGKIKDLRMKECEESIMAEEISETEKDIGDVVANIRKWVLENEQPDWGYLKALNRAFKNWEEAKEEPLADSYDKLLLLLKLIGPNGPRDRVYLSTGGKNSAEKILESLDGDSYRSEPRSFWMKKNYYPWESLGMSPEAYKKLLELRKDKNFDGFTIREAYDAIPRYLGKRYFITEEQFIGSLTPETLLLGKCFVSSDRILKKMNEVGGEWKLALRYATYFFLEEMHIVIPRIPKF